MNVMEMMGCSCFIYLKGEGRREEEETAWEIMKKEYSAYE